MAKRVKIIMSKDVLNLGEEGDVCDVAPGYARNFLFPRKLAVPYTKHHLTILGQRRRIIEKRKEEKRINAQGMKSHIEGEHIVFHLPAGENGKLFGSITNGHIAEELQKKGFAIEKKKIEVPEHHIKMVGEYTITVKLYENEQASLKVTVEALEVEKEEKTKRPAKGGHGRSRSARQNAEETGAAQTADTEEMTEAATETEFDAADEESSVAANEESENLD